MLNKARHRLVLMAAVVALMAGCQYDGMLSDPLQETENREALAITFGNSVTDNPVHTRSTLTRHLSDLDTTMGVWGWFVDMDGIERRIFNNQLVNYDKQKEKWTYLPEKYWQNGSGHKFCAYAPHGNKVDGASVSFNLTDTMINITGITLKGSNTMSAKPLPQPKGINTFINVDDTDWMIDRKIHRVFRNMITFNMQHILVKLIVTAKSTSVPAGCLVVIDSLTVGDFVSKGDFAQKRRYTPDPTQPADAGVNEWTLYTSEPRYTLYSAEDDTLSPNVEYCMIESLLLPQGIIPSQELNIYYSIYITGNHIQHFYESKRIDELFNSFNSECAYRIQLTINPGFIVFQTGTTKWVNQNDYEYLDVSHKNDGD